MDTNVWMTAQEFIRLARDLELIDGDGSRKLERLARSTATWCWREPGLRAMEETMKMQDRSIAALKGQITKLKKSIRSHRR
jgi:hypothetical protein